MQDTRPLDMSWLFLPPLTPQLGLWMPEKTISELSAIKSVYSRNTADNDFL